MPVPAAGGSRLHRRTGRREDDDGKGGDKSRRVAIAFGVTETREEDAATGDGTREEMI